MKNENSSNKPIGLLYDSVNNNTGDKAIGVALSDYLGLRKISHQIVDPFSFSVDEFEFLIVGGGLLLRDEGDDFYDCFRLKGNHALMAMGTFVSKNIDYLNEYKKVSVRSEADKNRLLEIDPELQVEVVPCITLTMKKPEVLPVDVKNTIGIHFVADTLQNCTDFEKIINSLPGKKAVLPFTFYNHDSNLMKKANLVGDYIYLDEYDPKTIFGLIGEMSAVVVSSLHATIFAYANGIPFLTYYQDKVQEFLDDRNLGHLSFRNSEELKEKLHFLEYSGEGIPFEESLKNDVKKIDKFFDELLSDIPENKDYSKSSYELEELSTEAQLKRSKLDSSLLQVVVAHRDDLIGNLIQRNVISQIDIENIKTELELRDRTLSAKLMRLERRLKNFISKRLLRR